VLIDELDGPAVASVGVRRSANGEPKVGLRNLERPVVVSNFHVRPDVAVENGNVETSSAMTLSRLIDLLCAQAALRSRERQVEQRLECVAGSLLGTSIRATEEDSGSQNQVTSQYDVLNPLGDLLSVLDGSNVRR
jgi:hypothetical protein